MKKTLGVFRSREGCIDTEGIVVGVGDWIKDDDDPDGRLYEVKAISDDGLVRSISPFMEESVTMTMEKATELLHHWYS